MALTTFADKGGQQVTAQALDSNFATLQNEVNAATQAAQAAASGQNWKSDVVAASTANINIASALINGSVVDGVTLATGNRVLLIAQTDATQNGIYVVVASGAASRSTDANTSALITGTLVFVAGGTANGNKQFALTTPAPIALGTSALTFTAVIDQGAVNASAVQPLVNEAAASAAAAAASASKLTTIPSRNGFLWAMLSPLERILQGHLYDGTFIAKLFLVSGRGTTVTRHPNFSYAIDTPMDTSRRWGGLKWVLKTPAGKILAAFDSRGVPVVTKVQHHEVASFRTNGTISAWVVVDTWGNPVLKTMDTAGVVRTLSGISNVSGLEIAQSKIVFFGTIKGERAYWWCNPDGSALYHATALRAITCDGDSLTASSGVSAPTNAWPYLLGYRNNIAVLNGGVPGTKSGQIAFRAGGYTATAALAGNAIPASGAVTLSTWTLNGDTSSFAQPFYPQTSGSMRAFVTGSDGNQYEGTISVSGSVYSFTRTTPGSSVPVPNPATIHANLQGQDEWIHIIRLGQNDGYDQTQILPALTAIVANLKSLNKKFLIIGLTGSAADTIGTANYNTLQATNAAMAAAWPNNYARNTSGQDLRAFLVANYNPSLSQDVIDHGNDVVPTSLRSDLVHENDAGYDLTEQFVAGCLTAKGWI
jgi:hypothetical protein